MARSLADMKQTLITKICNYILVSLGFAGTASCEVIRCEYGTPTMDYAVSGKVVNQESAPIAGIQVSSLDHTEQAVLTAEDGSFIISGTGMSALLMFEDIDGAENGGEFADRIEKISVQQVKKGDGNWYMDKYEAKDVVIKMEEK